jgi:hypothetical protein
MCYCKQLFLIAILFFVVRGSAQAGDLPKQVGECVNTKIDSIATRLEGVRDSGSAVWFWNGGSQVGYDTVPAIEESRKGDPVRMCLVSIPRNCPKGYSLGRIYLTTNLRTRKGWTLPDSESGGVACGSARVGDLPKRVGDCVNTKIYWVGTRLGCSRGVGCRNDPDSGSAVNFKNGGSQVTYDTVPAIEESRKGDPVRMCLVSIPRNCPKGDNRGREYRTTNLRTRKSWTLPDSEHQCGGA